MTDIMKNVCDRCGLKWPGWIRILIWIFGLITFSGLALKEIVPLYLEYVNNNVATRIGVIGQQNASVRPPQVTLCIPWTLSSMYDVAEHLEKSLRNETSTCINCEKLAKYGWDVWKDMDFTNFTTIEQYQNALMIATVSKLLSTSQDGFQALSIDNAYWNKPLADTALGFIDCIQQLDQNLGIVDHENQSCWCVQTGQADQILSSKENISMLFRRLVDIGCEYLKFRDPITSKPYDKDVCVKMLEAQPSLIVEQQAFCFQLPMDDDQLSRALITSNEKTKYGPKSTVNDKVSAILVYSGNDIISLSYRLQNSGLSSDNSHPIYESQEDGDSVRIGYVAKTKVIETRSVPCYKENGPAECVSYCTVNEILDKCNCIPYTFRHNKNDTMLPYCTSIKYANCNFDKSKHLQMCHARCRDPCEYEDYSWVIDKRHNHIDGLVSSRFQFNVKKNKYRQFEIGLQPISTTLLEIEVTLKYTTSQLLSQLCSVFNFYLGFSGISAIGFVIFCRDAFHRWRSIANKKKASETTTAAVVENGYDNFAMARVRGPNGAIEVRLSEVEVHIAELRKSQDAVNKVMMELKKAMEENSKNGHCRKKSIFSISE